MISIVRGMNVTKVGKIRANHGNTNADILYEYKSAGIYVVRSEVVHLLLYMNTGV